MTLKEGVLHSSKRGLIVEELLEQHPRHIVGRYFLELSWLNRSGHKKGASRLSADRPPYLSASERAV